MVKEPYQVFETKWARFLGIDNAVACSTGTAALHLALVALEVGPGDEVIVPEFTMVACANAVTYTGATPVFVDCGDDFNIRPDLIVKAITPRTKAIMVAHIYGKPCDMDRIMEIAQSNDLFVIEDAAEAHGATYKGKLVGTIGDIGCFSHYKNKIIYAEEGGSCVTRNDFLAERMRSLRSHCFDENHTFLHTGIGFNYRMTNAMASQLLSLDWEELIAERKNADGSVNWVRPFVFETEAHRDAMFGTYERNGDNPRRMFMPMSMQPMYRKSDGTDKEKPWQALKAFYFGSHGLYLPWKR